MKMMLKIHYWKGGLAEGNVRFLHALSPIMLMASDAFFCIWIAIASSSPALKRSLEKPPSFLSSQTKPLSVYSSLCALSIKRPPRALVVRPIELWTSAELRCVWKEKEAKIMSNLPTRSLDQKTPLFIPRLALPALSSIATCPLFSTSTHSWGERRPAIKNPNLAS